MIKSTKKLCPIHSVQHALSKEGLLKVIQALIRTEDLKRQHAIRAKARKLIYYVYPSKGMQNATSGMTAYIAMSRKLAAIPDKDSPFRRNRPMTKATNQYACVMSRYITQKYLTVRFIFPLVGEQKNHQHSPRWWGIQVPFPMEASKPSRACYRGRLSFPIYLGGRSA